MVANLAPRKMKFGLSEGMILAASDPAGKHPVCSSWSRTRAPARNEGKVSESALVTIQPSSQCSPSHTIVNSVAASRDAGSSSRASSLRTIRRRRLTGCRPAGPHIVAGVRMHSPYTPSSLTC